MQAGEFELKCSPTGMLHRLGVFLTYSQVINASGAGILCAEAIAMSRRKKRKMDDISLNPESRVAELYDPTGIRKTEVADPSRAGMRVLDNCAEEHRQ